MEQEAGADIGKAYTFSPDSGKINEIATINNTPDSVAVLDTDENAPGYEFAAYADGNMLKIIDYSKTATQRIYELETYSTDICGIYPAKRPAYTVFDKESEYYLKTVDDTAVFVALKAGNTCSRASDTYRFVNFNIPGFPLIADSRSASTSDIFGGFLFDALYSGTDDNGDKIEGRSIWVGHNRDTESLSAREFNGITLFDIPFKHKLSNKPADVPENIPPFIIQASDNRLLIQKNKRAYDINNDLTSSTIELFDLSLSKLKKLLTSEGDISSGNAIEAYFSIPIDELAQNDQTTAVRHSNNGNYILFETDDGLHRYKFDSNKIENILLRDPGIQEFRFALLESGDAAVAKTYSGFQTLSLLSSNDSIGESLIINMASEINFSVAGNILFVNALRPSNILSKTSFSNTWVAAEIANNQVIRAVSEAILIFINQFEGKDEVLIASSSEPTIDENLIDPYISKYDGSYPDGIFNFEELSDDGERITARTAARIGQISGKVNAVSNDIEGANFGLNQLFGGFQVETTTGTKGFFFKPNQTENEENNREKTLELLRSKDSIESITVNSKSVTAQESDLSLEL
jgi:hypothetical protein